MRVKKSGDWEGEKLSLQKFLFENGMRIKSLFSVLCTCVAHACFLIPVFQENVVEITHVNLLT